MWVGILLLFPLLLGIFRYDHFFWLAAGELVWTVLTQLVQRFDWRIDRAEWWPASSGINKFLINLFPGRSPSAETKRPTNDAQACGAAEQLKLTDLRAPAFYGLACIGTLASIRFAMIQDLDWFQPVTLHGFSWSCAPRRDGTTNRYRQLGRSPVQLTTN